MRERPTHRFYLRAQRQMERGVLTSKTADENARRSTLIVVAMILFFSVSLCLCGEKSRLSSLLMLHLFHHFGLRPFQFCWRDVAHMRR